MRIEDVSGWVDQSLVQLSWKQRGRDMEFCFLEPGNESPGGRFRTVHLTWAGGLKLHLGLGPRESLFPCLWELTVEDLASGRKSLHFDFLERGTIEIECEEATVTWSDRAPNQE